MFLSADYTASPVHIVPEWYFLFAYAILRSIPNKSLGVCMLALSLAIFFTFLIFNFYVNLPNIVLKKITGIFIFSRIYLSWLGQCLVEPPYIFLGGLFTRLYFIVVLIFILIWCGFYSFYELFFEVTLLNEFFVN